MNKKENITLIKGFKKNEDGTLSCRDFNFGKEEEIIGKTFTLGNNKPLSICKNGFHACDGIGKTFCFYDDIKNSSYYKIKVAEAFFEDAEKFVFKEFTVLEKVFLYKFSRRNTGSWNTGDKNTGNWNMGDWNVGNCNLGDRNTGDCNTGNDNTGNDNTGNWNMGDWNTGNCNLGDRNTGDWNTGYDNTGDCNTGNCNMGNDNTGNCNTGNDNTGNWNTGDDNTGGFNTGDDNTGDKNTGDWNTGDWNLTNYSSGFFAIEEPKATCFGLPTEYSVTEFKHNFKNIINNEPTFENLMLLPNATEEIVKKYINKYNKLNNKNNED